MTRLIADSTVLAVLGLRPGAVSNAQEHDLGQWAGVIEVERCRGPPFAGGHPFFVVAGRSLDDLAAFVACRSLCGKSRCSQPRHENLQWAIRESSLSGSLAGSSASAGASRRQSSGRAVMPDGRVSVPGVREWIIVDDRSDRIGLGVGLVSLEERSVEGRAGFDGRRADAQLGVDPDGDAIDDWQPTVAIAPVQSPPAVASLRGHRPGSTAAGGSACGRGSSRAADRRDALFP